MCIGFFQKRETRPNEEGIRGTRQEIKKIKITEIVKNYYDELLKLGYLFKDLYDMTLYELDETLKNRKQGIAYEIWKKAMMNTYIRNPEEFPKTPEEASPELFPPKKTYKMPEFLKKGRR